MRKFKYIKIFTELIFLLIGLIAWISFDDKLVGFLIILASTLLANGTWFIFIKLQLQKNKLVQIKHAKGPGLKLANVFLGILMLSIFLYIFFNDDKTFTDPILAPIYVGTANSLFMITNCFFIDNQGIIQPETFKKNLTWDDLSDFNIENGNLSFSIKNEIHNFKITPEKERTIRDLKV